MEVSLLSWEGLKIDGFHAKAQRNKRRKAAASLGKGY